MDEKKLRRMIVENVAGQELVTIDPMRHTAICWDGAKRYTVYDLDLEYECVVWQEERDQYTEQAAATLRDNVRNGSYVGLIDEDYEQQKMREKAPEPVVPVGKRGANMHWSDSADEWRECPECLEYPEGMILAQLEGYEGIVSVERCDSCRKYPDDPAAAREYSMIVCGSPRHMAVIVDIGDVAELRDWP